MCCAYGQRTWLLKLITPIPAAVDLPANYTAFLQYDTLLFEFMDQYSLAVLVVFTLYYVFKINAIWPS